MPRIDEFTKMPDFDLTTLPIGETIIDIPDKHYMTNPLNPKRSTIGPMTVVLIRHEDGGIDMLAKHGVLDQWVDVTPPGSKGMNQAILAGKKSGGRAVITDLTAAVNALNATQILDMSEDQLRDLSRRLESAKVGVDYLATLCMVQTWLPQPVPDDEGDEDV